MVSKRPPLLGYNHNVRHAGRLFHVQTEDSGPSRPVITTHIFYEGTILATARTQYQADEPDAVVQRKMQDQHKSMLKRVRDGAFDYAQDEQGRPAASAEGSARADASAPRDLSMDPPTSRMGAVAAVKPAVPASTISAKAASSVPSPINEERTAEIVRPSESAKPTAPAAGLVPPPPPPPPPAAPVPGSLADRLRRGGPASKPAVPAAGTRPPAPEAVKVVAAPVVEFVADADDDEPAVTIEAAEPSPAEDVLLSSETPLPAARPLGRESLNTEFDETMRMRASQMPQIVQQQAAQLQQTAPPVSQVSSTAPPIQAPAPGRVPPSAARPQTTRAIPSALPRPRPTAEGVVVGRYPVVPSRRAPLEPFRVTATMARPTVPAPLALSVPALPASEEGALDAGVLSYLARDVRR